MTPEEYITLRSWIAQVESAGYALASRVATLEQLLTPEQHAQLKLIKQAERVVEIARAEGQLGATDVG